MSDAMRQQLEAISQKLDRALAAARNGAGGGASQTSSSFGISAGGELRSEVLTALSKVSSATSGDELFESIMGGAITTSEAECGLILLIENGNRVVFRIGYGADAGFLARPENKVAMAVINRVLRSRTAEVVADASGGQASPGRAVMCSPIVFGERFGEPELGGILYVERRGQPFSELAAVSMRTLVGLATLAVESFTLHEEAGNAGDRASRFRDNLEKLLEVSRKISSILDVDELLSLIVDKALEVTMASRGYIMLRDRDTGDLVFKVGRSWNRKMGDARKAMSLTEGQFQFSKSITSRCIDERKSVCLTDALGDDAEAASVSIVQMELQSVMCAPLLDGDDVLGLVYVDSKAKTQEFGEGDLELFEGLAGQAAIALKNAILYAQAGEQERMRGELDIAATMQADLLPKTVPQVDGISLAGLMRPAKEVGGDYFDYIVDEQRGREAVSIVVGDVSGKGLGAGIVAVMARCHLRTMLRAYGGESPNAILSVINTILAQDTKPGQFMTMILCWWDSLLSTLKYSSAGHEHIVHWKAAEGRAFSTVSGGTALGLVPTPRCTEDQQITLLPGDMVLLYTDGVTEAMNENYEEYSLEMLEEVVNKNAQGTPQQLVDAVMAELDAFVGKAEQSDDITLVAIKRG